MPVGLQLIVLPAVNRRFTARGQEFGRQRIETLLGRKMEDLAPEGSQSRIESWKEVEKWLGVVNGWMEAEDLFVMGDIVSFVDFVIAGFLIWMRNALSEDSGEWRDVIQWHKGRWGRLLVDLEQYSSIR